MGGKTSKLNPKDLRELCEQTEFDRDEIKQWYEGFKKDCPSGSITKEQYSNMYATYFPNGDAESFAERVFLTYDSNGDGVIDFREFVCALSIMSRGTLDQKLSWAFSLYDINQDGTISVDELSEIVRGIYKMVQNDIEMDEIPGTPDELVDEILTLMDSDNDNKLSRVEFMEGCEKNPHLLKIIKPL